MSILFELCEYFFTAEPLYTVITFYYTAVFLVVNNSLLSNCLVFCGVIISFPNCNETIKHILSLVKNMNPWDFVSFLYHSFWPGTLCPPVPVWTLHSLTLLSFWSSPIIIWAALLELKFLSSCMFLYFWFLPSFKKEILWSLMLQTYKNVCIYRYCMIVHYVHVLCNIQQG